MKAARINQFGPAENVQITEIEAPTPGAGQVQIEVHAASINPYDSTVREGKAQQYAPVELPVTLGGDIAGVVSAVGDGADGLIVGESVYGQANAVAGNSGAFAEFAATSTGQVAKAPSNVSLEEAAALPLVGVSALQALTEHLNLQAGQKIFIHGGAGGIGTIAIQIAKHIGAFVAATATGEGVDYIKKLGADQAIDYKTTDFNAVLTNFDAVFDTVGGEDFLKSLDILHAGAIAVSMIGHVDPATAQAKNVTALTQMTEVTTKRLDALRELVEAGVVTPHIDKTFPLEQVVQAFQARESGTVKGKVVLRIKQ